jgi:hypothetical protein
MRVDFEKLFALAKPYLERNDLGSAHTSRVLAIARRNFPMPEQLEDLTVSSIILHDIGGSSIKEQYEKGPGIAVSVLLQMGCDEDFIKQVCQIVGTHHNHPDNPSTAFRSLYDADKIVMFSPEEFSIYDARPKFDWDKIVGLIYTEQGKKLAKGMLQQRRKEQKQATQSEP